MIRRLDDNSDSGMESLPGSSKDITPEKMPAIEDNFDHEEDETFAERLQGLTEMFPESVRNITYKTVVGTKTGIKSLYQFSRSAVWIFFSSSIILIAPVLFEVERCQVQVAQLNHQKQLLLGPSTAIGAGNPLGPPGMPVMPR